MAQAQCPDVQYTDTLEGVQYRGWNKHSFDDFDLYVPPANSPHAFAILQYNKGHWNFGPNSASLRLPLHLIANLRSTIQLAKGERHVSIILAKKNLCYVRAAYVKEK